MEFSIEFLGLGWAKLRLTQGVHSITHGFTYLTDAPRDLLNNVISLLQNGPEANCLWESEPALYSWAFINNAGNVTLSIKCYAEGYISPNLTPDFECILRVSLRELAATIVTGFRDILSDIGPDGYEAKWFAYPFPMEELLRAESVMRNLSPFTVD